LGLLVEEARTNLVTYSEDFSDADWIKGSGLTIGVDNNVAPDGTFTADQIITSTSVITQQVAQSITFSATQYACSVYIKAAGYTQAFIRAGGTINLNFIFDLVAGTVVSGVGATITPVGNGWYRATAVFTGQATTTGVGIGVAFEGSASFAGDGTSGIYIWGAQLEAGSFPTSYIPTSGSTVTRSADVASIGVSEFGYNQSEGTLVGNIVGLVTDPDNNPRIAAFSDGTNNNRISLLRTSSNDTAGLFFVKDGNFALTGSAAVNDCDFAGKYAGAYKVNDVAAVTKGGVVGVDLTSPAIPVVDRLNIGSSWANSSFLNGHIKSIKYYPRRLTNAQLQELTS
jgi:hypothetical protein